MTKAEFIDQVAAKSGLAKKDAARAVDAFIETVSSTLHAAATSRSPGSASSTSRRALRAPV